MSVTGREGQSRRLFGRRISRRDLLRGMLAGLGAAGVAARFGSSSAGEPAPRRLAALAPSASKLANSVGKEMPADAAPLAQQVLRMMGRDTKYYDIGYSQYDSSWPQEMMFETLGRLTKDHNAVPGAAERWETRDAKTWRFYLRKDAKWSDGAPVTAKDFEFSFLRRLDPKTAYDFVWFYLDIKNARGFNTGKITDPKQVGVRALQDYVFEMELEGPIPYWPLIVSFRTSSPCPRHIVEKVGNEWSTNPATLISNGPYKVDKWERGRRLELILNPTYSGPHKGYLERFIKPFGEWDAYFPAYEAGESEAIIDIAALSPGNLARAQADPVMSRELHKLTDFLTWYVFFQVTKPPFNDLRVRQAFSHAIDREILCKSALAGQGVPAYEMLPPGFPSNQAGKLNGIQNYDPAQARRLLAEAGYPDGKGFPAVDLWLRNPTAQVKTAAEAIQAMYKDNLGVTINIKPQEQKIYMDGMRAYRIPMSLISYEYDYADPSNMLGGVWHSQPVGAGRHDWKNDTFDKLVDEAKGLMDQKKRTEMYNEAERILVSDVGGVMVWHPIRVMMWKTYVVGESISPNKAGVSSWYVGNNPVPSIYIAKH
jgi:ABC-type oligopeptide transport system substrate-binding subunit